MNNEFPRACFYKLLTMFGRTNTQSPFLSSYENHKKEADALCVEELLIASWPVIETFMPQVIEPTRPDPGGLY